MIGRAFSILALAALIAALPGTLSRLAAQDQSAIAPSKQEEGVPLPRFRQIDPAGKPQSFTRPLITVLADDDFPPFSYAGPAGEAQGIAVDAAQAACQE